MDHSQLLELDLSLTQAYGERALRVITGEVDGRDDLATTGTDELDMEVGDAGDRWVLKHRSEEVIAHGGADGLADEEPAVAVHEDDGGDAEEHPDEDRPDRIVFGGLTSASGFTVMAHDIPGSSPAEAAPAPGARREHGMTITDRPFFLSVRGETLAEVAAYWEGLSAGAAIIEPLAASEWSPGFGMLTDRFGVTWVVDVQPAK